MIAVTMSSDEAAELLGRYREHIDECDAALVKILARRFEITEKVGELKALVELPAADPAREAAQVASLHELAEAEGLNPEVAESVWRHIVELVKARHREIAGK